jgi:hypothetical protein
MPYSATGAAACLDVGEGVRSSDLLGLEFKSGLNYDEF